MILTCQRKGERGLLSTELAILMPVMLVIALLSVFVVQVGRQQSRAQQAADAAARAASLSLDSDSARDAAQRAADAVCNGTVVVQDFDYEPADRTQWEPGSVLVEVTCTEDFGAFGPLVGDGTRTETGVAISVVEYWRPGEAPTGSP